MSTDYNGYTQRDWERTVGWGKVPEEYRRVPTGNTDEQNTKGSDKVREENQGTSEEGKKYSLNDPIWDKRWTDDIR